MYQPTIHDSIKFHGSSVTFHGRSPTTMRLLEESDKGTIDVILDETQVGTEGPDGSKIDRTTVDDVEIPDVVTLSVRNERFLVASDIFTRKETITNEDLAFAAGQGVKKTATSFVAVTSSLIDASVSFTQTPEAMEATQAITLAGSAAVESTRDLGDVFQAMKDVWNQSLNLTFAETFTKMFSDTSVLSSVDSLTTNSMKSSKELVAATSAVSSGLNKRINANNKWSNSISNLSSGVQLLLAVLVVSATRVFGELRLEKLLPTSKEEEAFNTAKPQNILK